MITQLVYISASQIDDRQGELEQILAVSRKNNAEIGVTGVLLHAQSTFFQVLEGDPGKLEPLYQRISKDPRHGDVTELMRKQVHERRFADWNMGMAHIPPDHPAARQIEDLAGQGPLAEETSEDTVDGLISAFFTLNQV